MDSRSVETFLTQISCEDSDLNRDLKKHYFGTQTIFCIIVFLFSSAFKEFVKHVSMLQIANGEDAGRRLFQALANNSTTNGKEGCLNSYRNQTEKKNHFFSYEIFSILNVRRRCENVFCSFIAVIDPDTFAAFYDAFTQVSKYCRCDEHPYRFAVIIFFSLSFVAITWLFSPTGGLPTLFHSFWLKRLFFWCSFHSFVNLIFAFFINRLAWWPRVFHYVILFWNATRWCSYWIHVCFAFDFILCSTDFSLYLSIASTSLTSAE